MSIMFFLWKSWFSRQIYLKQLPQIHGKEILCTDSSVTYDKSRLRIEKFAELIQSDNGRVFVQKSTGYTPPKCRTIKINIRF